MPLCHAALPRGVASWRLWHGVLARHVCAAGVVCWRSVLARRVWAARLRLHDTAWRGGVGQADELVGVPFTSLIVGPYECVGACVLERERD